MHIESEGVYSVIPTAMGATVGIVVFEDPSFKGLYHFASFDPSWTSKNWQNFKKPPFLRIRAEKLQEI